MRGLEVRRVEAFALDVPMRAPFEIAGGTSTAARNVLVRAELSDGSVGWGEGAPMGAFNGDSQGATLKAARAAAAKLAGLPAAGPRPLLEAAERLLRGRGAACAAVGMALIDAWCRSKRVPLRWLYGGASSRVESDVTVTIVPPEQAAREAKAIAGMGVRTIKVKVGKDVGEDAARVVAVAGARRGLRLIVDANQGYGPRQALDLLRRVRAKGVEPALFEQPAAREDWDGLAAVHRLGRVDVAADESVSTREEAVRMAAKPRVQVVNVKLMKSGLLEAWDIALICRAAGLGLMAGGMVETSLSMACAAHMAAGLGRFDYIDLDTPLWLSSDPMRGVCFGRGGAYDLTRVRAGIGVSPKG